MNLLELLLEGAAKDQKKTAVIDDGVELSYKNLLRAARGVGSLISRETQRDVAAIFLPTCKEFALTYMGILMAGKATLPFNILLSPEDLKFVADDAGVDTVVTSRKFLKIMGREEAICDAVENVICLEDVAGSKWKKIRLLAKGMFFSPRIVGDDELATLLYTSGTTGRPKGVCLTHTNIRHDIVACSELMRFRGSEVVAQLLPLFHTFALTVTMGVTFAAGATAVAIKRFAPDPVLDAIERYRVTYLVAIPSMYRVLNRSQGQKARDASSLACAISGGEPLPAEVRDRFKELFGLELLEGYGLTEASPVVSVNPSGASRPGTVGPPIPGVEVRVIGEDGAELARGQTGEICVRGPIVMKGYHNRPEETAEILDPDGWLRTGDMGRLDEEGYICITGRKKEMMIVGGENVYPAEIEDVLSRHPAVADVGVIGVKDERRGEAPKAFVVLAEGAKATEGELQAFCREKLPTYKVPRSIAFRDELPKAPTGKVLRRMLREEGEG